MDNLLLDCLFLLDKDLPFWNVVIIIVLEDLHQALEFGRMIPVSAPNDNHHRLLEDTEPMCCIEDPCRNFLHLKIAPGVIRLIDNADEDLNPSESNLGT